MIEQNIVLFYGHRDLKVIDMNDKVELKPKIYESPDNGKTIYERDFGSDPSTRTLIKTSVQQQWNITFNEKPVDL